MNSMFKILNNYLNFTMAHKAKFGLLYDYSYINIIHAFHKKNLNPTKMHSVINIFYCSTLCLATRLFCTFPLK